MTVQNIRTARKAVNAPRTTMRSEPSPIAVRYILDRFDVSPSLARTIAALAFLGVR